MKAQLAKFSKTILALCELVLGIILLINPRGFTGAIIVILGALLFSFGIIYILRYFKAQPEEAAKEQNLTQGLLAMLFGLFCAFKSEWFFLAFPLLTALYGLIMLIAGVAKVQWTVDLLRLKSKKWFWAGIGAALTLICAVITLCNPFRTTAALWIFIGITLIAEAVTDMLTVFFAKNRADAKAETPAEDK